MASSGGDRFVVGVDFGTTYSGVAFTYSGNIEAADEIAVVKDWPGANNVSSEKVPSELAYVPASDADEFEIINPDSSDAFEIRWGLELKPDQPRLRCLKLRLDPRQELPHYVSKQDLDDQLNTCGKTTEDAIADYLSVVYSHAKEVMVNRFGEQMMSSTPPEIVVTVPAIWSDAAKDATFRVAKKAGMGTNIRMISEPEAAAIYAFKSMEQETKVLGVGDSFIVCDCGGGTVDLAAFSVRSLAPLSLEESAPGTGALCGGVFLNLRFQALVKSRMGAIAFKNLLDSKPKAWAVALRYFEDYVKKNFNPLSSRSRYDDSKFNVPLPGVEDNTAAGIDCGFFILSSCEVAELFRPLVDSVIELVERQRNVLLACGKTPKGVILVGGFGNSAYLFKCLKSRFAHDDSPPSYNQSISRFSPEPEVKFVVLQPANAWTAVVRGAVLSSIQEKVVHTRKARRHYGVRHHSVFDESKHSIKNKFWDVLDERYKADNQITWYTKRGDDLPTEEPFLFDFRRKWAHEDPIPEYASSSIMVSDDDSAPQEYERSATSKTRTLCRLHVDLSDVPRHLFKEHVNSLGVRYRTLSYKIGMTVESGYIIWDLRVKGIVYGEVEAEFE
ncbi:actin-like ATPase domain-containing protein, partial [Aureobasidium melanogenum]|uniref:Actin-like ATPase domain-containing protein n=1 Tax=Aureobasidium melanogenum (strain CBS 110374) TaxID=1043003 RepID=A0A074W8Q6_AURM1